MLYRAAVLLSEGLTRERPTTEHPQCEWLPFLKGLQAKKAPVACSLEGTLLCLEWLLTHGTWLL